MSAEEVPTEHGPARACLLPPQQGRRGAGGLLMLGHGAGGSVDAPDLLAATEAAQGAGWHVALVTQPYRVAGRRAPAPARQLDAAWLAVAAHLRDQLAPELGAGMPVVVGGRSSGARVACRTAAAMGAQAVLALAFPLHPPGKAADPGASRQGELDGAGVPVLVIQGEQDRFTVPEPDRGRQRQVVVLAGDHSLRRDPAGIRRAVRGWLAGRC